MISIQDILSIVQDKKKSVEVSIRYTLGDREGSVPRPRQEGPRHAGRLQVHGLADFVFVYFADFLYHVKQFPRFMRNKINDKKDIEIYSYCFVHLVILVLYFI